MVVAHEFFDALPFHVIEVNTDRSVFINHLSKALENNSRVARSQDFFIRPVNYDTFIQLNPSN
jgi:SAM-dependent MidA family methyltransferase